MGALSNIIMLCELLENPAPSSSSFPQQSDVVKVRSSILPDLCRKSGAACATLWSDGRPPGKGNHKDLHRNRNCNWTIRHVHGYDQKVRPDVRRLARCNDRGATVLQLPIERYPHHQTSSGWTVNSFPFSLTCLPSLSRFPFFLIS